MPMTRLELPRLGIAVAALALSLTACGGGDGAGSDEPEADVPPTGKMGNILCSEVWAEGKTMPEGFDACDLSEEDPTISVAISEQCGDGRVLVTSSDQGWAFAGEKVNLLKDNRFVDDPDYMKADQECAGTPIS